ncbi:MAG: hypothetical protein C0417_05695 [Chlorobiaceae bacterium]|nr:hypothetical protein [Chlorobiaceae bacterium]
MTNPYVKSLANSGANLFAGTYGGGVFLSTNNGTNWVDVSSTLTFLGKQVNVLEVYGANIWAGTDDGVFRSINNGQSWTSASIGLTTLKVNALKADEIYLFAGTAGGGVFRSTNYGTDWSVVNSGLDNMTINAFAKIDTNLFAGTGAGVFRSSNNGTSWTSVNTGLLPISSVNGLAVSSKNLFATTSRVFLTTNLGENWTEHSDSLPIISIKAITVGPITLTTNLFACPERQGLWRRPLSELITSVNNPAGEIPTQFNLEQNYPNPFNPSTVISYHLPAGQAGLPVNSWVTLKIYDLLGQEVATLVDENKKAGNYKIQFDGSKLASSIYFYSLVAGDYIAVKKFILIR